MEFDKHKLWLIIGVVFVVLVLGFLLYFIAQQKGVVGHAGATGGAEKVDDYYAPFSKEVTSNDFASSSKKDYSFKIKSSHTLYINNWNIQTNQLLIYLDKKDVPNNIPLKNYPQSSNNLADAIVTQHDSFIVTVDSVKLNFTLIKADSTGVVFSLSSPGASCNSGLSKGLVLENYTGSGYYKLCTGGKWVVCDSNLKFATLQYKSDTVCHYNLKDGKVISEWYECNADKKKDTIIKMPGNAKKGPGVSSFSDDILCFNEGGIDKWYSCGVGSDDGNIIKYNSKLGSYLCSNLNPPPKLDNAKYLWIDTSILSKESNCADKKDDDQDGRIDCEDEDCAIDTACKVACAAGTADCDKDSVNKCEVNVNTDVNNCGVCGTKCLTEQTCQAGKCVTLPPVKEILCTDAKDNDGDGQVDCADNDCITNDVCALYCTSEKYCVERQLGDSCVANKCTSKPTIVSLDKCQGVGYNWVEGQSYKLMNDIKLDATSAVCLQPTKSKITLDCNNKKISGNNGVGIFLEQLNGVSIKNCNIANFKIGINVAGGKNNTFINNYLVNNKETGIVLQGTTGAVLQKNNISLNGNDGVSLLNSVVSSSTGIVFTNNLICWNNKNKGSMYGDFNCGNPAFKNSASGVGNMLDPSIDCADIWPRAEKTTKGCPVQAKITSVEICTNSIDDDVDGKVDCLDSDCASNANCKTCLNVSLLPYKTVPATDISSTEQHRREVCESVGCKLYGDEEASGKTTDQTNDQCLGISNGKCPDVSKYSFTGELFNTARQSLCLSVAGCSYYGIAVSEGYNAQCQKCAAHSTITSTGCSCDAGWIDANGVKTDGCEQGANQFDLNSNSCIDQSEAMNAVDAFYQNKATMEDVMNAVNSWLAPAVGC